MAGTTSWLVAWKKGSTWGTAVVVAAGDGIKIVSESMSSGVPEPIMDVNVGDALAGSVMQGNFKAQGNIVQPVRYDGIERILAPFFGGDTKTAHAGETIVFDHLMDFAASSTGYFGTLVFDKGMGASHIWEYPSCKPTSLELAHADGKLQATWEFIADRCERGSPTNVNTDVAAATVPNTGSLAIFNQMTLLFKEVTGTEGNLTSGEELLVTDLKLTINRNLSGVAVSGSKAGSYDEPETDGLPEGKLEFTMPNLVAAVDNLIKAAATRQTGSVPKTYKAQITWLGNNVTGSAVPTKHSLDIKLPALTIAEAPANAGGPGAKVPVTLTFNIQTPQWTYVSGNGTDWSWVVAGTKPVRALLVNALTLDAA